MSFSCIAPGVDETARAGEAPVDLVARLARAKAAAVSAQQPKAWVIGSDQIAVLDGGEAPLGKPGTEAGCQEQLRSCSGRSVKSEGLGISLCESIDGTDPSALIGLPLIRLSAALRAAGFEVP